MSRKLLPKEHGAYSQLLVPLITEWTFGRWHLGAFALTIAAIFAFFLHEPAMILLGRRGKRIKQETHPTALYWLGVCVFGAVIPGLWSLSTLSPSTRVWIIPVVLLAGVFALFSWKNKEKTLLGESIALCALTSICVPISLSLGHDLVKTLVCYGVWVASFGTSTAAVKAVLANHKHTSPVSSYTSLVLFTALLLPFGYIGLKYVLCTLPCLFCAYFWTINKPHTKRLMTVGWTLLVASLLTAVGVAYLKRQ